MGWRNLMWGGPAACIAAGLPLIAVAGQDTCDDNDVRFLQSHGFTPREMRLACTGSEGVPAPAKALRSEAAPPAPAPAPSLAKAAAQREIPVAKPGTGQSQQKEAATQEPAPAQTADPLSAFTTSTSTGSTLTTVHIVTAYAPVRSKAQKPDDVGCQKKVERNLSDGALGLDVSASLPAQSSTPRDYGRHALSKLDGGVLNILGSWGLWTPGDPVFCRLSSGDGTNPRITSFDHFYWGSAEGPDQMVPYVKHGAGVRAVKTKLEGGTLGGVGTAYLGLGVDGPLLSTLAARKDPRAGWFTIEAFGVANVVNHRTLESLFLGEGEKVRAPRSFVTANARVKIDLPGRFYLAAEYAKPFGGFKGRIGDTSIVTFGYNNQSDPGSKKSNGNQAAAAR